MTSLLLGVLSLSLKAFLPGDDLRSDSLEDALGSDGDGLEGEGFSLSADKELLCRRLVVDLISHSTSTTAGFGRSDITEDVALYLLLRFGGSLILNSPSLSLGGGFGREEVMEGVSLQLLWGALEYLFSLLRITLASDIML